MKNENLLGNLSARDVYAKLFSERKPQLKISLCYQASCSWPRAAGEKSILLCGF